jgi:uncharacterized protein DUF1844
LPTDKQAPRELKVTDKRIFTPDGEIREEFKQEIRPADPAAERVAEPQPQAPAEQAQPPQSRSEKSQREEQKKNDAAADERRRSMSEKAESPGTPFTNFVEGLIMQAYMFLGMLRNPYQPQTKTDPTAARQLIDILVLLQEKTTGNLTPEEEDFLSTHVGDLKLAYVQRTKSI